MIKRFKWTILLNRTGLKSKNESSFGIKIMKRLDFLFITRAHCKTTNSPTRLHIIKALILDFCNSLYVFIFGYFG
jgi:hypothetical protein